MKNFIYIISICLLIAQGLVNTILYFWAFADFFAKHIPQSSVPISFLLYFCINLIITGILTFVFCAAEA